MSEAQRTFTLPVSTEDSVLYTRLLGPVRPLAQWTDPIEVTAGQVIAGSPVTNLLTEGPNSNPDYGWMGPNYYDRCAWAYRYAAASGRQDILDRARFYAVNVSQTPYLANAEQRAITGDYTIPVSANRDCTPRGLAIAAADDRDPATQAIAKNGVACSAYQGWLNCTSVSFKDPREDGNGLLALVLSHASGPDCTPTRWGVVWDSLAKVNNQLNKVLTAQQSWGGWNTVYPTNGLLETPVYMQGLVLEALQAYYDFITPDTRILPAMQRCMDWLISRYKPAPNPPNSDNRSGEGGWVYSYLTDGATEQNVNVYPSLSFSHIGPMGWIGGVYKTFIDIPFQALVREGVLGPGTGVGPSKESNQWSRAIVPWIALRRP